MLRSDPGVLRRDLLELGGELGPHLGHGGGLGGEQDLGSGRGLGVPEGDGSVQLLVLQLGAAHSGRVLNFNECWSIH